MIDIKKILTDNGVSGEVVDTIADTIKAELPKDFVPKNQYNKKVGQIDYLNNKIADLEANASNDTSKADYEALKNEFETYKSDIENGKVTETKTNAIKELLKSQGVKNDKLANLLIKEFDINSIELEDNKIKGADDLLKPIRENYNDFFTTTTVEGASPATPPQSTPTHTESNPLADALGKLL